MGGLLRATRKLAGISGEELAARLGISQSTLSRLELGNGTCAPDLGGRWAAECGASVDRAAEIAGLIETIALASTPRHGRGKGDIARFQREVGDSEGLAGAMSVWSPRLVPGLLQTPAYAREVFACADLEVEELSSAVAARMARQAVLYDPARAIRLLLSEAALRWPIETVETQVAQLDRLALFAADGTVRFGVVPFRAPFGAFSYHGWTVRADQADDEPDEVRVELETAEVAITEPDQVASYRDAFERLAKVAVYGEQASAMIREIRAELAATD